MRITQYTSEFGPLIARVGSIRPRIVLEIGIDWGGTLLHWCDLVGARGLVVGIDCDKNVIAKIRTNFGNHIFRIFRIARIIVGDSRAAETLASVKRILKGRYLDFLFIDGDHSYEGVKADYQMYSRLVRPGGMIALHDIATPPTVRNPYQKGSYVGVSKFWGELTAARKEEFIDRGVANPFGIGLITKDAA